MQTACRKQFGLVLKEGPAEDTPTGEAIAKLLRCLTHAILPPRPCRWKLRLPDEEGQEKSTTSPQTAMRRRNSPHTELLRKKGIEVLLLSDRIDSG